MQVTRSTRHQLQLQNLLFVIMTLLIAGMLAWLSTQYRFESDWSSSGRNTLSIDSKKLLDEMPGTIRITAFARDNALLREQIRDLISRYQRHKSDIELQFINPDTDPDRVRELGISMDGELLASYQGRNEKIRTLAEQPLTNALMRIARAQQRHVVFLTGHGERNPNGQANHDFGQFGALLKQKGLILNLLNLSEHPNVDDDTSLLVIADPATRLLTGEVKILRQYMDQGGNLLWLLESDDLSGLGALAETLGIEILPGVVVDATTQLFGIEDPAFALITTYPVHPVTGEMDSLTLFPQAAAMDVTAPKGWQAQPLLTTLERAWTEMPPLEGTIRFDQDSDERMGPLDIGYAFTRTPGDDSIDGDTAENDPDSEHREQRVVVIGDSDFLSNAYLGNGGNINLGLNLFNWLNQDDQFISISARTASDTSLELSTASQAVIGLGFLLVLPALLVLTGVTVWWRRRQR